MMNNLYEYIDPIVSPYEAFVFDSGADPLPIPAHWHYYVELLYILEGTAGITMDNAVQICPQGTVVFFPPKCVHTISAADRSERIRYYVVKFDPAILSTGHMDKMNLRAAIHGISVSSYPCCFGPEQAEQLQLLPLFEEVIGEYRAKEYGFSLILTADLRNMMGKFFRYWQKQGYIFHAPDVHPAYEISFDRISEYIDNHYFEELTAEKLAAMCNMSHSTFSLNFHRRYRMTCKEYINTTRINVAENMLLFSNHDVAFIAQEVGYSDCSYFIRCYKKLKGVTPKQARKAGR